MPIAYCDNLNCMLNNGKGICFGAMFYDVEREQCPDYIPYKNILGGDNNEGQSNSMRALC
jgi:hypothetical protein